MSNCAFQATLQLHPFPCAQLQNKKRSLVREQGRWRRDCLPRRSAALGESGGQYSWHGTALAAACTPPAVAHAARHSRLCVRQCVCWHSVMQAGQARRGSDTQCAQRQQGMAAVQGMRAANIMVTALAAHTHPSSPAVLCRLAAGAAAQAHRPLPTAVAHGNAVNAGEH